ncbi:hypothetical protein SCLCIDRAFT_136862, partial [Scleroderma citrinum Foug A]
HCKRELIHAIWMLLLDDEFIEAYRNGIVVRCYDGVLCCIYPRIFTYSADYPEKILLVTICDNGSSPCPRCCVPRALFGRLGFVSDILSRLSQACNYLQNKIRSARHAIYQCGKAIKSVTIEQILKEHSLVPTLVSSAL